MSEVMIPKMMSIDFGHHSNLQIENAVMDVSARKTFRVLILVITNADTAVETHQLALARLFIELLELKLVYFKGCILRKSKGSSTWMDALTASKSMRDVRINGTCTMYPLFVKEIMGVVEKSGVIESIFLGGSTRRFKTNFLSKLLSNNGNLRHLGMGCTEKKVLFRGVMKRDAKICSGKEIVKIVGENKKIEDLYVESVAFLPQELTNLAKNTSLQNLSMTCVVGKISWLDFVTYISGIFKNNQQLKSLVLVDETLPSPVPAIAWESTDSRYRLVAKAIIVRELMETCRSRQLRLDLKPEIVFVGGPGGGNCADLFVARRLGLKLDLSTQGTHREHWLMHSVWLYWREKELAAVMAMHTRLGANSCLGLLGDDVMRRIFTEYL
jgi:hypothetical protein